MQYRLVIMGKSRSKNNKDLGIRYEIQFEEYKFIFLTLIRFQTGANWSEGKNILIL